MSGLILPQTGILYFTTANTGGGLDLSVPEGTGQFRREDPHGVLFIGPSNMSIQKRDLPTIARFFAGAAMLLGTSQGELNMGWDAL